jgi:hypothetical protein
VTVRKRLPIRAWTALIQLSPARFHAGILLDDDWINDDRIFDRHV